MIRFPNFAAEIAEDHSRKGSLFAVEFRDLPFLPQRAFVVSGAGAGAIRGEHAHKKCQQMLVCITGKIEVVIDHGTKEESHSLESPGDAVLIPPMVWGRQIYSGPEATLLVLASIPYSKDDYIDEYVDFISGIKNRVVPPGLDIFD